MGGGWPGFESPAAGWRHHARRPVVNTNERERERRARPRQRAREINSISGYPSLNKVFNTYTSQS
jgi:hypothetical protein